MAEEATTSQNIKSRVSEELRFGKMNASRWMNCRNFKENRQTWRRWVLFELNSRSGGGYAGIFHLKSTRRINTAFFFPSLPGA